MKRDMDLIRAILIAIEDDESTAPKRFSLEDVPQDKVDYHVNLLVEAGLVRAPVTTIHFGAPYPESLTWAGHEFLDAARNDTLWEKAKKLTLEKTGALGFEVLKEALIAVGKAALISAL